MKKFLFTTFVIFSFSLLNGEDASLNFIIGTVEIKEGVSWKPAELNQKVKEGDVLRTGIDSQAEILFEDGNIVKLRENTKLKLTKARIDSITGSRKTTVKNLLGGILGKIVSFARGRDAFYLTSEVSVAGIRGTIVASEVGLNKTSVISVLEGEVEVKAIGIDAPSVMVKAGEKTTVKRGKPPSEPVELSDEEVKELRQWAGIKEEVPPPEKEEEAIEKGEVPPEKKEEAPVKAEPKAKRPFSVNGAIGTAVIEDEIYNSMSLRPEIPLGKLAIVLDLTFYFDSDQNLRTEDWNSADDILDKIYYIRYGREGDPIFGQIGALPYITFGNGLIIDNYSNTVEYPSIKRTGFVLGTTYRNVKTQIMIGDLGNPALLGGRVVLSPLKNFDIPVIKNIEVGATAGYDMDQYSNLLDRDGDGYPDPFDDFPDDKNKYKDTDGDGWDDFEDIDADGDNELDWTHGGNDSIVVLLPEPFKLPDEKRTILVYGGDITLPLFSTDLVSIRTYADFARIQDYGYGIAAPGVGIRVGPVNFKAEYRQSKDKFLYGYYDRLYEKNKAILVVKDDSSYAYTKEDELNSVLPSLSGFLAGIGVNLFNLLFCEITYQDLRSEQYEEGKNIYGEVALLAGIPKVRNIKTYYSQKNVKNLFELKTDDTIVGVNAELLLGSNLSLLVAYRETYIDRDGNGKIEGSAETNRETNVSIGFQLF